ncbi:ATP-binding protein [Desulfoplanes sp.]
MKKLPIGISTFSEFIEDIYYYVDKTSYVHQLIEGGKYYFLSRPRRFGKSLFVDTLKCAFEGRRELFAGLYLEKHWDWEDVRPVITISFGRGHVLGVDELTLRIKTILDENAQANGVRCTNELSADRFAELMRKLHEKTGKRVVILVDEYDKPILDNIENPVKAARIRDVLKDLYSVIKDSDGHIRFCFITGVSKFSRVSIFSGLNNLTDISLDAEFGALCGYTRDELETTFADRLEGVDRGLLQEWYDGYNFLGAHKVYNPFDVLLFFQKKQFGNYWFESATPSFLVKLLQQNKVYLPSLDNIQIDQGMLSGCELDALLPEAVLFQSGYLTIKHVEEFAPGQRIFTLDFPNYEVRVSLNLHLLNHLSGVPSQTSSLRLNLIRALRQADLEQVRDLFKSLLSSIPNEWYTNNNLDAYEGYYASVIYACLASLGFALRPEESSSHGRADLILDTGDIVYVMEFKVVEIEGDGQKAIEQIREKGYHHQYVQAGRKVVLVGMDFSREERNLVGFGYEMGDGAYANDDEQR